MKWSRRLQTLAEEVAEGAPMADICTDHAYLPIHLKREGICPHVILCDVSRGSLQKAEADWKNVLPDEPADLRLGDGLQVLREGEVKTVVMAGIGGILTADIMEHDLNKARSFSRYVLQPRSHAGYLRWRLACDGFQIDREQIAPEGRRLCEILTVSPDFSAASGTKNSASRGKWQEENNQQNPAGLSAFHAIDLDVQSQFSYPDDLHPDEPYVREYLMRHLEKQRKILQNQEKAADLQSQSEEIIRTRALITRLEKLLQIKE